MQTLEFTRAVREITAATKVNELISLLSGWLYIAPNLNTQQMQQQAQAGVGDSDKDRFQSLVLDSHAGYDSALKNEATKKVVEGMGIGELYEPGRMRRMLVNVSNASQVAMIRQNAEIYAFYGSLTSLQRMEHTCTKLLEQEKFGSTRSSDGVIALQMVDYDEGSVDPARLARVASVLVSLHTNLARLLDVKDDKLAIKYLDSGSDFILGLQGAKAIIDAIGPLFLQFWNKLMFRRQESFERDIEALSKGLEFMGKTKEAVDKGVLTEEEGKNLRARVFRGVDELIGLGVSLPLKDSTLIDQRQLLIERRSVKLLGSGQAQPSEDDDTEQTR